jgi:hypothetical protein
MASFTFATNKRVNRAADLKSRPIRIVNGFLTSPRGFVSEPAARATQSCAQGFRKDFENGQGLQLWRRCGMRD